jgi:peroxisomal coenzyme A diphosphatase NUDT7
MHTVVQYREAFEEVALPLNHPAIHTLCVLRPFVAYTRLLVSPVVAFLAELSVLDGLVPSQGEVDVIFSHPLEALLEPSLSAKEELVEINSELWPSEEEFYVSHNTCLSAFLTQVIDTPRITRIASGRC